MNHVKLHSKHSPSNGNELQPPERNNNKKRRKINIHKKTTKMDIPAIFRGMIKTSNIKKEEE